MRQILHEGANHVIDLAGVYRGPNMTIIPPAGSRLIFLAAQIRLKQELTGHVGSPVFIDSKPFRILNYQKMMSIAMSSFLDTTEETEEKVKRWTFYHTFN